MRFRKELFIYRFQCERLHEFEQLLQLQKMSEYMNTSPDRDVKQQTSMNCRS